VHPKWLSSHHNEVRRRLRRVLVIATHFLLRSSHLPNCCACSRASTRLKLPPKLNCSMLRMSHGLFALVESREKKRRRLLRLGLFVLIGVVVVRQHYGRLASLATKQ
jgi:hypothetical protein